MTLCSHKFVIFHCELTKDELNRFLDSEFSFKCLFIWFRIALKGKKCFQKPNSFRSRHYTPVIFNWQTSLCITLLHVLSIFWLITQISYTHSYDWTHSEGLATLKNTINLLFFCHNIDRTGVFMPDWLQALCFIHSETNLLQFCG